MEITLCSPPKGKEISINGAYVSFMASLLAKNISPATVIYYNSCFKVLDDFCDTKTTMCAEINETFVKNVKIKIMEKGVKDTSANSYLRGIRAMFYYFMNEEWINPPFKIKLLKGIKEVKETYTDDELTALLKKPDIKSCEFTEYRNWVIINYLLTTGNRTGTICELRVGDINLNTDNVKLRKTKNRQEQIIPINKSMRSILKEYITIAKGVEDDYLFCNKDGNKLTEDALKHAIHKYNKKRGVTIIMKTSDFVYICFAG